MVEEAGKEKESNHPSRSVRLKMAEHLHPTDSRGIYLKQWY